MTANILETIQQRRGNTAPKSLEYRKAFAECVEQYGDWEHYVKVLDGHDKNLASAIKRVVASLSEGHLATPDGLDSFFDDMELNTLYWTATDLNRQAGKDGDKAFQMAKAIAEYHLNESREADTQAALMQLERKALDEPGIRLPHNGDATSVASQRAASDDTGAPHPLTDGSSLGPLPSASDGILSVLSWIPSIFTGSK
jgi:hypothetical protein